MARIKYWDETSQTWKYADQSIPNSGGNADQSGLTAAQIAALDGMFQVCGFIKDDVSAEYNAFRVAFGLDSGGGDSGEAEKTLTSISAVYGGGEVAVGTAVADLTGIVVTAHYSDGSTATVTGYALSGTIAEGSNIITVSYGGKTTTFTVTGVAESGGDTPIEGEGWTDGVPYELTLIANEYPNKSTGAIVTGYAGWTRTDYTPCYGVSKLQPSVFTSIVSNGSNDNAFYDADKNYVGKFALAHNGSTITVPATAYYFIASHKTEVMESLTITPIVEE